MAYSSLSGMFSLIWDEAETTEVPDELGKAMCNLTNPTWPHTFVVPEVRQHGRIQAVCRRPTTST